ncbi:DUF1330 domain-containing protein [Papillibacter cinnamivorans]|uniref:Uncharacterized conserved protein, DUF1330 family n=1 Tax=Papillibacter cinnamivorans DSM 12816 TaxID=1122930 RepID=A0A1W2BHY5_9FIRM|nr:DUF1330 domain-containing protein [Papillibacter cinnamivorans]SMC72517.1 Uncharacterized conserved protein, DUF1330 family [Papillibacter cinnamivorans DSM 12816]
MGCYFMVTIYIDNPENRAPYDEYIRMVRPIVEKHGGKYLVRTEKLDCLTESWRPNRLIIVRFDSREALDQCFASEEYRSIKALRENTVDSRILIAEGE